MGRKEAGAKRKKNDESLKSGAHATYIFMKRFADYATPSYEPNPVEFESHKGFKDEPDVRMTCLHRNLPIVALKRTRTATVFQSLRASIPALVARRKKAPVTSSSP